MTETQTQNLGQEGITKKKPQNLYANFPLVVDDSVTAHAWGKTQTEQKIAEGAERAKEKIQQPHGIEETEVSV